RIYQITVFPLRFVSFYPEYLPSLRSSQFVRGLDMSRFTVCARFRPLSAREKREHGTSVCVQRIDNENFTLKDEKDGDFTFSFDRVYYEGSNQSDVFEFVALPILHDAFNGINGTIITYGQTGAGKTYSMEGPGVLHCKEDKGLLTRVVEWLLASTKSSSEVNACSIKFSMVEIYMEKIRDLFDLSKDNLQIKESKAQGILLHGRGIANRAVEETQMNMASSRSHCMYIFTVQQELPMDKRVKNGKLVLVDLAGSEKVEKTGAEGRVLEEAKMINKSLSTLGNVVNALTSSPKGKVNHVPYRDSKLTRLLQDALGGNSRTALLCCCSPSPVNASETISTLRFGARAKHIKASQCIKQAEDQNNNSQSIPLQNKDECCLRIINKLKEIMAYEAVELLEELFFLEGIIFYPNSVEELELDYEDVTSRTISSLQQAVEELSFAVRELKKENEVLKEELRISQNNQVHKLADEKKCFLHNLLPFLWLSSS
ncbi:hypothetical protein V2J09_007890, partial [Rumex salicifolius]